MDSKQFFAIFAVFSIAFFLMLFFLPESIGNDGNYHIRMAQQILEKGIFQKFEWLKFTVLNENFVDLHFLFHIFLIPFTFLGLGLGLKIATSVMAGLFFAIFFWFMEKHKIKHSIVWTGFLFFSSSFLIFRLFLGRAIVFGLIFLLIQLFLIEKKNYWGLLALAFVFVWFYIGFPMAIVVALCYAFAQYFIERKCDLKIVLYSITGTILGLVINPYFPKNVLLLYTTLIQIPFLREFGNNEWGLTNTLDFFTGLFGIFCLGVVLMHFLIERKLLLSKKSKIFFILTLVFFVISLKIVRALDYFVPIAVIFFAFAWNDLKLKKINFFSMKKLNLFILLVFLFCSIAFVIVSSYQTVSNSTETVDYKPCMEWLNYNTPKGSTVFLWYYHYFPTAYYYDANNTYTYGLDEHFGYDFDKNLFSKYKKIIESRQDLNSIPKDFNSNYIFIYKGDVGKDIVDSLKKKPELYTAIEAEKCIVFGFK